MTRTMLFFALTGSLLLSHTTLAADIPSANQHPTSSAATIDAAKGAAHTAASKKHSQERALEQRIGEPAERSSTSYDTNAYNNISPSSGPVIYNSQSVTGSTNSMLNTTTTASQPKIIRGTVATQQ